jgi:hypothetical protein
VRLCAVDGPVRLQASHHVEKPHVRLAKSRHGTTQNRLGAERYRHVERPADFRAEEPRRRHADDLERPSVERNRLADDRPIAPISRLPESVRQNRAWGAAPRSVICIREDTPNVRGDAQSIEIAAAHIQALRRAVFTVGPEIPRRDSPREEAGERLLLGLDRAPQWLAEHRTPAHKPTGTPLVVRIDVERRKFLGTLDGQRPQPHGVHQLEDRGVRARTQRERKDRHDRKCPVLEQQARTIAEVLPKRVDERQRVHLVDLFADAGGVSEFAVRGPCRFVEAHAPPHVVVHLVEQVILEFARPLVVPAPATEEA